MANKLRNIKYIDYANHYDLLGNKLMEWAELKPDNKDIQEMITSLTKIAFHMSDLSMEIEDMTAAFNDMRYQKNKAIDELKQFQYDILNNKIK